MGIAAVLSQRKENGEEKPIACVSRTLQPSELKYSTIFKESLAIHYGVHKFEQYLIGNKFELRTDHKPLIQIFGEHKQMPATHANRIQRWALYLSGFNYTIKHIQGKHNLLADYLSRAPTKVKIISPEFEERDNYLNFVASNLNEWPIDNDLLRKETLKDPILSKILKFIKSEKWPKCKNDNYKPYILKRHELVSENDVILWGHRVVLPKAIQKRLL